MGKNPDWNRTKVFRHLGAPLDNQYDWDGVRPGDGALFMQISHRDVRSMAAICLIDPDDVAEGYDVRSTMVRHRARRHRLLAIWHTKAPAFIVLSRTERDRKTGRERTIEITPHQVHRVLSFDARDDGSVWCAADPNLVS